MNYEKSYKGLGLFFLIFFSLLIGLSVIAALLLKEHSMRVTVNVIALGMAILMFTIYKNGKIYWLNSVEYEKALEAGEERRKRFALLHFKKFAYLAAFVLILTTVFSILNIAQWIDFTISIITLAVTAISTVRIEL